MKQLHKVRDCYNKSAESYLRKFGSELEHKPLDCLLLREFVRGNGAGPMLDFGCGPGQTTAYLHSLGVKDLTGVDLSDAMVKVASEAHPGIAFKQGNMEALTYESNSIASAIAFYAIVHFDYEELDSVFAEIQRVLRPGGEFLFSFHIGDEKVHTLDFLDHEVDVNFYFFDPERIKGILLFQQWEIKEAIMRFPYEGKELPNKRAYFWVRKPE